MSYKSTILKKILPFILILFASVCSFSQTKEIDSLKGLLLTSQLSDSSKVEICLVLTNKFFYTNIDSAYKFSKITLRKALSANKYKIVRAYGNIGTALDIKSQPDSARYYFDKALAELDKNENKIERSKIYTNYSLTYQYSDRIDLALEYNAKAIELVENNDNELCYLYYNQAMLYLKSGFPDSGKKYLKLAYESSRKADNLRVEGAVINSLGDRYIKEKKLDSARVYLEQGLRICELTKSAETCFQVNSTLGNLYVDMKLYANAEESYLKAKKYAELRNKIDNILLIFAQLGELENIRNNYEKSIQYFKQFEALYKFEGEEQLAIALDAYKSWSDTEFKSANYKKSYELLKDYIVIKDSIFTIENKEYLAEADAKFESEKKDKELAEQNLQIEQQELELQKKKTQYSYMTGAALVLLVGSVLLWFLYQQRQKRKNQEILTLKREQQVQTLESLMEGEEKERLRIAKELHDGVNVDLSAIKYKLTSLLEKNNQVINEAVKMIDKSCEQVRAISHNLIPPSLKDFSLIETVEDFCTTANSLHKPEIQFTHIGDAIQISKKAEVNIFRIVQELVNNSVKHAGATEISVQISHRENVIQLTVEDNGVGFDKETIKSDGIGLKNVQSRVDYLNAKLDFTSNEKGTSYIIDMNTDGLI